MWTHEQANGRTNKQRLSLLEMLLALQGSHCIDAFQGIRINFSGSNIPTASAVDTIASSMLFLWWLVPASLYKKG